MAMFSADPEIREYVERCQRDARQPEPPPVLVVGPAEIARQAAIVQAGAEARARMLEAEASRAAEPVTEPVPPTDRNP